MNRTDGIDKTTVLAWLVRLIWYLLGFCVFIFGAVLIVKSSIGSSPPGAIAELYAIITGLPLGSTSMFFNTSFIVLQMILYGKHFRPVLLSQLIPCILFSIVLEVFLPAGEWFNFLMNSYGKRMLLFLMGFTLFAFGSAMAFLTGIILPPSEENMRAIMWRTGWQLWLSKLVFSSVCLFLIILSSLLFLGRIERVGIGMVINTVCTGPVMQFFVGKLRPLYEKTLPVQCCQTVCTET